jgi:hypothetical protein
MTANTCYLCNRPFGLIRHRHSNKQFCSKKCLREWRSGVVRVLQQSVQRQEHHKRFLDWLGRTG